MGVEVWSPGVWVNIIDINGCDSEWDIDNKEEEKEYDDIVHHVGYADYDRPSGTPHQATLDWPGERSFLH